MFIIEDWAGNIIKEKTKSGLWVTPEFKSFEDGWGYIYEKFPGDEELWGDLYVMEKKENKPLIKPWMLDDGETIEEAGLVAEDEQLRTKGEN